MSMTIKYPVNYNYFDEWSPNMAYILGFTITDGCLEKDTNDNHRLTFNIKDKSILEFIRNEISPTRPIFERTRYRNDTRTIGYELRLHSSDHMSSKLKEYGMSCRKTGKEICPNFIPVEYFGDYFRGVFDGNGCIRITKNHNILSARFKITSASKIFLEQLNTYLSNNLYVYFRQKENVYDLCTSTKDKIKNIFHLMYNGNFTLERKYHIFKKAIEL